MQKYVYHSTSQLPRGPHAGAIVLSAVAAAADDDDVSAADVDEADGGTWTSLSCVSFFNDNKNKF